jgi:hypothetical protein
MNLVITFGRCGQDWAEARYCQEEHDVTLLFEQPP